MSQAVNWTTRRSTYTYYAHAFGTNFVNKPGNYIFGYQTTTGWIALYIGQTNNLNARLANHHKLDEARRRGATHILAHTSGNEMERLHEEADMIATFKPRCNETLK